MESYFRQGIQKIGLWALVVVMILVAMGVRSVGSKDQSDALNVFGHIYCSAETMEGAVAEENWVIRMEPDKTVLLRRSLGLWENLGIVSRGKAQDDAMEVWENGDGSCRVLVMRDGVCLEFEGQRVRLRRVDMLNVGVNTEGESQFLTPQWYQEGETVLVQQLSQCKVTGQVKLVLNMEEYEDTLTVVRDGEEFLLPRDRSRAFLLDTQGQPGEVQVFEVPFENGAYRFALEFVE